MYEYDSVYKNDFSPVGKKEEKIHPALWWLLVVVLFALAFVLWSKNADLLTSFVNSGKAEDIGGGKTLVTAREGRIVSGFPKELLLEKRTEILASYSVSSSRDNTVQPVVEYNSELSLADNIAKFGSYLKQNDWTIINKPKEGALAVSAYYARKNNRELNITFNSEGDAIKVTIALVEHK